MTKAEEEFWEDFYKKEAYRIKQDRNIAIANKVVTVLVIIVSIVWVLIKL